MLQLTAEEQQELTRLLKAELTAGEIMKTHVVLLARAGRRCVAGDRAQHSAAQNPPPQGGGPLPGLDNGDMTPGEIQQLFDAYLVMEAQQALR